MLTSLYDVTVVDTTNWFLLANRNLFPRETLPGLVDIMSWSVMTSLLDDESW